MSQIIIREKDLSSNPSAQLTEIAYVPGFSTLANAANLVGKPVLYDDLSTFKAEIGDAPAIFSTDATITYGDEKEYTFKAGDADTGYLYAVELLQQGLPVLYEVVSADTTSAQNMYNALAGAESTYTYNLIDDSDPSALANIIYDEDTDTYAFSYFYTENEDYKNTPMHDVQIYYYYNDDAWSSGAYFKVLHGPDSKYAVSDSIGLNSNIEFGRACEVTIGALDVIEYWSSSNVQWVDENTGYHIQGDPQHMLASSFFGYSDAGYAAACVEMYNSTAASGESILNKLRDRGTYNFKYLTTGGYPVFEYQNNMITKKLLEIAGAVNNTTDDREDTANGRGDVIAFIDHFNDKTRSLDPTNPNSVFYAMNHSFVESLSLNEKECLANATLFTPWCTYNLANAFTNNGEQIVNYDLPASFAYLTCLGKMLNQTVPTYDAIAGVSRGTVTNIAVDTTTGEYKVLTDEVLTNYIANQYQVVMSDKTGKISINALTQINPYGIVIYGDRTLLPSSRIDGVKASCILNIRSIVCDVKKQLYVAARRYMFQQNSDILWINFKSMVTPLLEQMVSGYGIKSYQITKDTIKSTKNSIFANITIVPIYPVEKFDITVNITDDDITVSED